jgi:hypothetical protein
MAGGRAVRVDGRRGYHPLRAMYTRTAVAPIERRLAAGHLTMTDLLANVRQRVAASDESAWLGDPNRRATVNTPAERRTLEALHNHER